MSAVGDVTYSRRHWKCVCGECGAYAADTLLGVEGERYTKTVQKHCCRLAADLSFAQTSENMHEMLGVNLAPETVRTMVERHGKAMAQFQRADTASEKAFQEAKGEVEFTTDAGKVNTREEGWLLHKQQEVLAQQAQKNQQDHLLLINLVSKYAPRDDKAEDPVFVAKPPEVPDKRD